MNNKLFELIIDQFQDNIAFEPTIIDMITIETLASTIIYQFTNEK